jgi:alpha-tubulin suppressor-like RCC1 family protein
VAAVVTTGRRERVRPCAVADGAVLVCGVEDERGTLGLPRNHEGEDHLPRTVLLPAPVPSLAGVRIRHVAAGFNCSLALSGAGQVYIWGQGCGGRLASDTEDRLVPTSVQELCQHRVRQVAIENDLCAAVTEEGLLFTWGRRRHIMAPPRSRSARAAIQRTCMCIDGTHAHTHARIGQTAQRLFRLQWSMGARCV